MGDTRRLFPTALPSVRFDLDPCATPRNAKCRRFFTRREDGLSRPWDTDGGAVFLNPPYGRQIGRWVKKAYEESLRGIPVVCLLPARTDTAWWQDYCAKGVVKFLRGRLRFGDGKNSAPFPSAIVIFASLDAPRGPLTDEGRQVLQLGSQSNGLFREEEAA